MSLLCKVKDDLIGTIRVRKKKQLLQLSKFLPTALNGLKTCSNLDFWEHLCATFQHFSRRFCPCQSVCGGIAAIAAAQFVRVGLNGLFSAR